LGVQFVFSFRGHYSYFSERRLVEKWVSSIGLKTPAVCDWSGSLARSFGVSGEPAISILRDGEILFVDSGVQWAGKAEKQIQSLLRADSPGLSLWPVNDENNVVIRTTDRWVLRENSKPLLTKQINLVGKWAFEETRVTTSDPEAEIHFQSPGSSVLIVARSLGDSIDPTRIYFDSEGASFSDSFAGSDFVADSEGASSLILGGPSSYSALRDLPLELRALRFRFPNAKISPVAIYGFEFGDRS
jgi:hypothetical protein